MFGDCSVYKVDQLLKHEMEGDSSGAKKIEEKLLSDFQGKDDEKDIRDTTECMGGCDHPQKRGGTLQEEALYRALLRQKTDVDLQKKLRSLFESCNTVTAQENMLLSLR